MDWGPSRTDWPGTENKTREVRVSYVECDQGEHGLHAAVLPRHLHQLRPGPHPGADGAAAGAQQRPRAGGHPGHGAGRAAAAGGHPRPAGQGPAPPPDPGPGGDAVRRGEEQRLGESQVSGQAASSSGR